MGFVDPFLLNFVWAHNYMPNIEKNVKKETDFNFKLQRSSDNKSVVKMMKTYLDWCTLVFRDNGLRGGWKKGYMSILRLGLCQGKLSFQKRKKKSLSDVGKMSSHAICYAKTVGLLSACQKRGKGTTHRCRGPLASFVIIHGKWTSNYPLPIRVMMSQPKIGRWAD